MWRFVTRSEVRGINCADASEVDRPRRNGQIVSSVTAGFTKVSQFVNHLCTFIMQSYGYSQFAMRNNIIEMPNIQMHSADGSVKMYARVGCILAIALLANGVQ